MPASEQNQINIPIIHPNVRNAEAFLNSWTEPFILEKREADHFSFRSVLSDLQVTIIFFNDYQEAVEYERKHYRPGSATERQTINGSALYAISGGDPHLVSSLAGHFAGRE